LDENDEPLKWQADNSINTFENVTNNDWIENLNGVKEYEFVPVNVNDENTGILLLDPNRNIYVELNENDSNYGELKENLRPLYNGKWVNEDYVRRLIILKKRLENFLHSSSVPDLLAGSSIYLKNTIE
jgi:hypothetical protein